MLLKARKLSRMYRTMQACIINVAKISTNAFQTGDSVHEHKQLKLSIKIFKIAVNAINKNTGFNPLYKYLGDILATYTTNAKKATTKI
mgnify:CR=1 FL=1